MKANTAVGFVCAGSAMLLARMPGRRTAAISAALAGFIVALGATTLAQYATRQSFGIDELLFTDHGTRALGAGNPGRMAPTTATYFVALGLGLLASRRFRRAARTFGAVTMAGGFVALLGYLFGVSALYQVAAYTSMALHTATAFTCLGFGLVLLHPRDLIASRATAGGVVLRRVLPASVAAIIVLGWLRLLGERAGFYPSAFGLSLMVTSSITVITGMLIVTARHLNEIDERRSRAEAELRDTNTDLEGRVAQRTAELAASEMRYRFLSDASPLGIVRVDHDLRATYVNEMFCTLTGRDESALLGDGWLECFGVDDVTEVRALCSFGEDPSETHSARVALSSRDGVTLRLDFRRERADDRNASGLIGTAADETAAVVAEAMLMRARDIAVEATALKSDFVASMSHEIRTPMNAVLGMTTLLLDTPLTEEQHEYASLVQSAGSALMQIIDDILDFSKIEAGKLRITVADFDLRSLLQEVVDLLRVRSDENGVALRMSVADHIALALAVRGDAGRIRQILLNLVGNAIKFTDQGEIVVHAKAAGGPDADNVVAITFEVTDTGIGIDPDAQERLFTAFEQVDASAARRQRGTGLGLTISKRLVEMMGGTIGVRSTAGVGSTFWFTLPFAMADAPTGTAHASAPVTRVLPSLSQGTRVLVAEDNPTNQLVVRRMLEKLGCVARIAATGVQALDALSDDEFDIVLMDCQMPDLDGLAATRELRRREGDARHTPVVALTASSLAADRDECARAGMDDFLSKPIHVDDLRTMLERWSHSAA